MRVVKGLVVCAALLTAATGQTATLDPLEILDRMNNAIRSLDYEGRFVVQSGDRLDALYIVHRVSDGNEVERVVSLTGEPREIIRGDTAVACLVPGDNAPINLSRRAQGRSYSPLTSIDGRELARYYDFEVLQQDRVAGRAVHQVEVVPKDTLRFGYRLSVDVDTGLPLRTQMIDSGRNTLSQMMFTDLKVGHDVTPIERDLSALQIAQSDPERWAARDRLAPAAWEIEPAPPGFRLNVHRRRALPDRSGELEHFIFSDGLATVSVYVQPSGNEAIEHSVSRHGAANAIGKPLGQHEVIVVGEVPVETLDLFAGAIRAVR